MDEKRKRESKIKSMKNLMPISEVNKDPEKMRQRNSRAGKISAQRKKERANMANAFEILLSLGASGKTKEMLAAMGFADDEQTNAMAVVATIFSEAMSGDSKAQEMILEYGLKVSEDARKTKEAEARMLAIKKNTGDITVSSSDGDDGDVLIYLPQIEEIEEDPEEKNESIQTIPDKEE